MKKINLTLGLGFLILGASAQFKITKTITAKQVSHAVELGNTSLAKVAATSTLTPPTFTAGGCATNSANIVYYNAFTAPQATANFTVESKGYAFGTNLTTYTLSPALAAGLGTPTLTSNGNKSAQKYNITGSASVTGVIVFTGIAEGTGIVSAKVYDENTTTKAPNNQLGTTATKALNTFTGNDFISFGTPIPLTTGNFFVSIENTPMGGAGLDTLSILSTAAGCSTTDSLSWRYDEVIPANPALSSEWAPVKAVFGANLDLLIFPVVDITTGLNSVSKGNLTLLAAFPNPASNDITINFGLNQSSKVEIEVYDVTGKMVNSIKLDNLEVGNHSSKINTSNLNAGVYMYSVKSDNAKMFSKFTVAK